MSDRRDHTLDVACMTAIGGREDIMKSLFALPAMQKLIDVKRRPGTRNLIEFNKVYMFAAWYGHRHLLKFLDAKFENKSIFKFFKMTTEDASMAMTHACAGGGAAGVATAQYVLNKHRALKPAWSDENLQFIKPGDWEVGYWATACTNLAVEWERMYGEPPDWWMDSEDEDYSWE